MANKKMSEKNFVFLVFLGMPGAGKGTVALKTKRRKHFFHISTGDIIRNEIKKQTPLGKKISNIVKKGLLVSDSIVKKLLEKNLEKILAGKEKAFVIVDGFPRNVKQAKLFEKISKKFNAKIAVFYFKITKKEAIRRLTSRLYCPKCLRIYSKINKEMMPKRKWYCDKCNVPLKQRDDDKRSVVVKRLKVYDEETKPLLNYYKDKGILIVIDAMKEPKEVYKEFNEKLKEWLKKD